MSDTLATEMRAANPRGRVTIAVEGVDAGATREFADRLAMAIRATGAHSVRARASAFVSTEGSDHPFLRSALLDPFRAGEAFPLFGSRADGTVLFDPVWTSPPPDCYLVVDGWLLGSDELRGAWDYRLRGEE